MAKFRKKSVLIEAVQWFKNGDHPDDGCTDTCVESGAKIPEGKEGRWLS